VGPVKVSKTPELRLTRNNGSRISAPPEASAWDPEGHAKTKIERLVLSVCALTGSNGRVEWVPYPPADPDSAPAELDMPSIMQSPLVLPYLGDLKEVFSGITGIRNVNAGHKLVRVALDARFFEEHSDLQEFAIAMFWRLSDPETIAGAAVLKQGSIGLWHKFAGALFCSMNWDGIAREYAPPYLVRTEDGKTVEITREVLESWAEAETSPGRQ